MIMNSIKTNTFFIVPIALWIIFYGLLLIEPSPFSSSFFMLMLVGVIPYGILWLIAARYPAKAGICKIGSVTIFTTTIVLAVKFLFFTHGEAAIGFLYLPYFVLILIVYLILILPLAAMIIFMRRRFRRNQK